MRQVHFNQNQEQGTVFVWVAVLCAVCMMVALGVANLGSATKSEAIAQNAADAAALSAAYEIAHSNSDFACSSARVAAGKNKASITSCVATNEDVMVEVVLNRDTSISAMARAEVD